MPEKTRILVVDDDAQLVREVRAFLEQRGYAVTVAQDGLEALRLAAETAPNLVVLDINFPAPKSSKGRMLDGLEVLKRLRETDSTPILMLSATNISAVKVMALSAGADDYVSKPFELPELGARVEAILRRASHAVAGEKVLSFHRLRLDPGERRVWKDGELVDLTGLEFDILYTLALRPAHVFSRDAIIDRAWKGEALCVPQAVNVHIGHIRQKLEDDPSHPVFITTVRGSGYRFEDVPA
ncbi:response regulator transcription factor [bacterium]|nr:response regulator transcription factor [bacterium]